MKFAKEGVINPSTLCEYPISLNLILGESGDEGKQFSQILITIVTKLYSPDPDTMEGSIQKFTYANYCHLGESP